MKTPVMLALVLAIASCATGPKTAPDGRRTIRFESEPTGGRVFWGNGATKKGVKFIYVGAAPCELTLNVHRDGTLIGRQGAFVFSMFVPESYIFECRPTGAMPGAVTNRQVFRTSTLFRGNDQAPDKLFFDLREGAAKAP